MTPLPFLEFNIHLHHGDSAICLSRRDLANAPYHKDTKIIFLLTKEISYAII